MVKDITKLFGSNIMDTRPKKLTADHFAQFTPVLPMTDDEIHALSPVAL
jgi:protein-tyrosine-phosphatase